MKLADELGISRNCSAEKRQSIHLLGSIEHLQHHFVSANHRKLLPVTLPAHVNHPRSLLSDQGWHCIQGGVSITHHFYILSEHFHLMIMVNISPSDPTSKVTSNPLWVRFPRRHQLPRLSCHRHH